MPLALARMAAFRSSFGLCIWPTGRGRQPSRYGLEKRTRAALDINMEWSSPFPQTCGVFVCVFVCHGVLLYSELTGWLGKLHAEILHKRPRLVTLLSFTRISITGGPPGSLASAPMAHSQQAPPLHQPQAQPPSRPASPAARRPGASAPRAQTPWCAPPFWTCR